MNEDIFQFTKEPVRAVNWIWSHRYLIGKVTLWVTVSAAIWNLVFRCHLTDSAVPPRTARSHLHVAAYETPPPVTSTALPWVPRSGGTYLPPPSHASLTRGQYASPSKGETETWPLEDRGFKILAHFLPVNCNELQYTREELGADKVWLGSSNCRGTSCPQDLCPLTFHRRCSNSASDRLTPRGGAASWVDRHLPPLRHKTKCLEGSFKVNC